MGRWRIVPKSGAGAHDAIHPKKWRVQRVVIHFIWIYTSLLHLIYLFLCIYYYYYFFFLNLDCYDWEYGGVADGLMVYIFTHTQKLGQALGNAGGHDHCTCSAHVVLPPRRGLLRQQEGPAKEGLLLLWFFLQGSWRIGCVCFRRPHTRVTRDNRTMSAFRSDVVQLFYLLAFSFYLICLCCFLSEITTGPEGKQPREYVDLKEEME